MSPYRSPADMPKEPEVVSAELFAFATVVGFQAIAFLLIGLALQ